MRPGPDRLAQSRRPAGISHTPKRLTAANTLASSPMDHPHPSEDLAGVSLLRIGADGLVVTERDFWNHR